MPGHLHTLGGARNHSFPRLTSYTSAPSGCSWSVGIPGLPHHPFHLEQPCFLNSSELTT